MPAFAVPRRQASAIATAEPDRPTTFPVRKTAAAAHKLPASGEELRERLAGYEAKLVDEGVCEKGELIRHVTEAGEKAGFGPDLETWTKPGFSLAAKETRTFENRARRSNTRAVA